MTASGGSDIVLLMVLGVTVVVMTIRVIARQHRLKQEALAAQPAEPVRRSNADRSGDRGG
ncbi:hypothetical protein GCM10009630_17980 [Kribbella jejuensis]|uniref:Uncharacterized protein n=1 Tax=Kribbella jejuensis TaxID=236068 RepID=A0A542ELV2_9ACTN|nr:hypothetical protein [Kribbella jejuensis]TQJ16234.1 hypothetical protein FB475_0323 [Kribbella jejuensis]